MNDNVFTLIGYAVVFEISGGIAIGLICLVIDKVIFEIKFRKEQKEWLAKSFEFLGGRYSTKDFRVVNGKIEHK